MISFLSLVQIIFGSSGNHILLMFQVISQHIQQIHDLRLIVDQRQHDHTKMYPATVYACTADSE